MPFDLTQSLALLTRTPAALDALLRDLPPAWTESGEGPESWSAHQVIAHLANLERASWLSRILLILHSGESRPFARVDRDPEGSASLPQALDEFAGLRAANLAELRALNLQPAQLALRGTHPSLGTVTLAQLLAAWTVHDLTHLHQITRVLAHQYRDAVGPWLRFEGVLNCHGHSQPA